MAHKQPDLDSSIFQATANDCRVCIPKDYFSIHPDEDRCLLDVYLCRAGDQWWLITASIIEQDHLQLPNLWRANLFEGMMQNDQRFILPVTFFSGGYPTTWSESWDAIIPKARRHWIKTQSDKEQGCFEITHQRKHSATSINWPDDDFGALIHRAFRGRLITTRADAVAKLLRTSCRETIEEMDD